jgi:ammonia channel protein AmtB
VLTLGLLPAPLTPCSGYVIVAWIWSAIWYLPLDLIKWGMCWVLNEDGFRDRVGGVHVLDLQPAALCLLWDRDGMSHWQRSKAC